MKMTIKRQCAAMGLLLGGMSAPAMAANTISVTSTFVGEVCDGALCFQPIDNFVRTWEDANAYCTRQGQRLPTGDELEALYARYPDNKIHTELGWPSDIRVWSSSGRAGLHDMISLSSGIVHNNGGTTYNDGDEAIDVYVTCVR